MDDAELYICPDNPTGILKQGNTYFVKEMDNVYENLQVQPCQMHEPNEGPKKNMAAAQSSGRRKIFYQRMSMAFFGLWIITLVALIAGLCVSIQQRRNVQNELKEFQNKTLMQVSELQEKLDDKNGDHLKLAQQNAQLQNFAKGVVLEISRKEGVILSPVWKFIREAAVDVTLDLNRAHGNLTFSEDKKEVRFTETSQNHPKKPESFDSWYGVLGKESFYSGRFYYEVQVSQKPCYVVGVVKESINRKETIKENPAKGFWTIKLMKGAYTAAGDPPITIDREKPQKVGVYVDYEEGQISFYNVETRSQIYTFTGYNFTEKMYPAFNPCTGTPSVPLIITPVSDEA